LKISSVPEFSPGLTLPQVNRKEMKRRKGIEKRMLLA
jgi:hypothetical protein